MTWIQTANGGGWDLLSPRVADLDWDMIACSLAKITRFTGHPLERYSVAEHCCWVARQLRREWQLYGLIHDAHEGLVGDPSSPFKRALEIIDPRATAAIQELQDRQDRVLYPALGLEWPIPAEIKAAVKRADLVMLATERRDVMPEPSHDLAARGYVWVDLPDPLPHRILGLSDWRQAAGCWLFCLSKARSGIDLRSLDVGLRSVGPHNQNRLNPGEGPK